MARGIHPGTRRIEENEMSSEARVLIPFAALAFAGVLGYAVYLQLLIWHVV